MMGVPIERIPEAAAEASRLLVEQIQNVLGDELVGAWLHGGTTFPDRPRQVGDLDICAVISRAAPSDRDPSSWREDPRSRPSRLDTAQTSIAQDRHVAFDTMYLLADEIGDGQPPPLAFHQARPVLSWPIYQAHWLAGQYVHLHGRRPEEMVIAPTRAELVRALDRELEHLERHVFEGDSCRSVRDDLCHLERLPDPLLAGNRFAGHFETVGRCLGTRAPGRKLACADRGGGPFLRRRTETNPLHF